MEIIKFKTNIDNEESLSRVAPYLDKEESISRWKLDTGSIENILSVSGTDLDPQRIENVVKQAGFKAEIIRVIGIGGKDL
ncbi:copper chaperone [Pontibacter qinzhouensis]|uniref:Copper chaperone n=1 Tax=Pontibacter qinzhouensis TaxID=2603253 RepID=A0A5C8K9N8_9BACT|nr:copper chaperone [Pontibacter qinzhouensis]TXK45860.1 copper chaperone [Pontibacter qinzhouensis]